MLELLIVVASCSASYWVQLVLGRDPWSLGSRLRTLTTAPLTLHVPCPRPFADFAANAKCSGNTLSLCGTFANNSMANKLYNDFTVNLVGPNALALIGVGDQTFCDQYPSSLITVRSSAYPGQIGYSWGPDCYRQRAIDQCTLGTVDYTATCPAPECNVCWKWTIYGSQDYYYGDQACFMAMVGLGDSERGRRTGCRTVVPPLTYSRQAGAGKCQVEVERI